MLFWLLFWFGRTVQVIIILIHTLVSGYGSYYTAAVILRVRGAVIPWVQVQVQVHTGAIRVWVQYIDRVHTGAYGCIQVWVQYI